jgi:hypothetical protein
VVLALVSDVALGAGHQTPPLGAPHHPLRLLLRSKSFRRL